MNQAAPQKRFWLGCLAICALALLVRMPSGYLSHNEPDEVIYWTLAKQLADGQPYSLQNTLLLKQFLPADMYDWPLFHHPPLFPLLLVPFTGLGNHAPAWQAIAVPWVGALLATLAVALALHAAAARGLALWLPVLGMAFDPLSLFLSRKLWIDPILAGLVALGLALTFAGTERGRNRALFALGGLALGLAALSKLVSVLALPVAACLIFWGPSARAAKRLSRRTQLALVFVPALGLTALWLVCFWHEYGTLIPWWSAPSAEILARDSYIRTACERPVSYYPLRLLNVQPILIACLAGFALSPTALRQRGTRWALVWLALFLGCLTWIGQSGNSPNFLRYLAPAVPAGYVLIGMQLQELEGKRRLVLAGLALFAIGYGTNFALPYLSTSVDNELPLTPLERELGLWQNP